MAVARFTACQDPFVIAQEDQAFLPVTSMQGTVSNRTLIQPRTLDDALRMMRDEGPLVPMAGCTDLYVGLNFGSLRDTRFLNLWKLDTLRRIERHGTTLSIGALTTYTALVRSPLV